MKKYYLIIEYANGEKETHYSNSEYYIRKIMKTMYDELGGMYVRYWDALIHSNIPGGSDY